MDLHRLFVGEDSKVLREQPFQLILIANILGPIGTAMLSPILDSLIEPFDASAANIGLMISAFTAPAIVVIPIVGVLADRYGRKPLIILGLLCFGMAGTAIAGTTNFRIVLLLRLIQGIGSAALVPILITSLGDLYTGTKETTAQGLRLTGSGLSQMVFPFLAGTLVVVAWQYPFFLFAIAFPIAAMIYIWFEEPSNSDLGEVKSSDFQEQISRVWELSTQRRAAAMVLVRGMPNVIWTGFLTYNSILVVRLIDGTPTQAGLLVGFGSLSYAISATQAGRISRISSNRLYLLIAMNLALVGGITVVYLANSMWKAYVGIVLMGVGFGVLLSLYRSIITNLAPAELRGGLVSLAESMGRVTATLTPLIMGAGIAIATPQVGFEMSVKFVGIGVSTIAAAISIICLIIVSRSPPIRLPQ